MNVRHENKDIQRVHEHTSVPLMTFPIVHHAIPLIACRMLQYPKKIVDLLQKLIQSENKC